MNNFRSYEEMQIEVIRATIEPIKIITQACALTQGKNKNDIINPDLLIKYLFTANHTSVFEHVNITVLISGVSRSFLAQITRHRMGSFTSASQHYEDYSGYDFIADKNTITYQAFIDTCDHADEAYNYLISTDVPKEEARQVLPNAKAVNIFWTVNARSLINFFNQRLCKRNVKEMQIFANYMHHICMNWFPELFIWTGPDCKTLGGCTQGRMKAKECIKANVPDFIR